ncbi:hypothetical protein BH20ACI4_BH20ACI4_22880 [soil metagenome]
MNENLSMDMPFHSDKPKGNTFTGLEEINKKNLAMDNYKQTGLAIRADSRSFASESELPSAKTITDALDDKDSIFELVIGKSDFLEAWFLEVGLKASKAVCLVKAEGVDYKGRDGSWSGTGFLVSPNVLLTNNHVLNSFEVAQNGTCVFNYQENELGKIQPTKEYRINPSRLFLTNSYKELDFTFVWVDNEPGNDFGFIKPERSFFKIFDDEPANIIQHPAGRPKKLALQNNTIKMQNVNTVLYSSDTEPGSSGSAVFNNSWKLVALHHASKKSPPSIKDYEYLNEGIKLSAIAIYMESLLNNPEVGNSAQEVLQLFAGRDSVAGFFGSLGRLEENGRDGFETVVDSYKGDGDDIDVGFWNIEWFTKHPEKIEPVAKVIADMNLDIWAFSESAPEVTEKLVKHLEEKYALDYGWDASEPKASKGKQSTTVIWNNKTVEGKRDEWDEEVQKWLKVDSRDFDDLILEATEGKVFDRYPGLFKFKSKQNVNSEVIDFYLVPLHLKAMAEGSKRRRLASQILAAAVKKMIEKTGADEDWILGGDVNAELASQDFEKLLSGNMIALGAEDENNGAFSYLKNPYKSLIDNIFLSANLAKTYNSKDYFIIAKEKTIPNYLKELSDHRPVLVRLSLNKQGDRSKESQRKKAKLPTGLEEMLKVFN